MQHVEHKVVASLSPLPTPQPVLIPVYVPHEIYDLPLGIRRVRVERTSVALWPRLVLYKAAK